MQFAELCLCWTLLAFWSPSWTRAGEGVPAGDRALGPCGASLRAKEDCDPGKHESMCPFLFSLPPMTVYLPQHLTELQSIMLDLQKLKETVAELKEMCADCTASQSEQKCGKHEGQTEGKRQHQDERNWMNEKRDTNDCGKGGAKESSMDGDDDKRKRLNVDEKAKNKWEIDKKSGGEDKRAKTMTEYKEEERVIKDGNDLWGETAGGNMNPILETNPAKTDGGRKKEDTKEVNSKGYQDDMLEKEKPINLHHDTKKDIVHNIWRNETRKSYKKADIETSNRLKTSKHQGEHNSDYRKEKEEVQTKEMEQGTEGELNNGKLKHSDSLEHTQKERAVTKGQLGDAEVETGIQTENVQRDGNGGISSSVTTKRTGFFPIRPTPLTMTRLDSRLDSNEAETFTSSLPSQSVLHSTLSSITDVRHDTNSAYKLSQSINSGAAGFSKELKWLPATASTTAADAPRQQITEASTDSTSEESHIINTSTLSTTTPHQKLHSTSSPRVKDQSFWVQKNIKSGLIPPPGQGSKAGEKHKAGIAPEAEQKLKNLKNDRKLKQGPSADRKAKSNQKQKLPPHKPMSGKSKPGKDLKPIQVSKANGRITPKNLAFINIKKNNATHHQINNRKVSQKQKFTISPALHTPSSQPPQNEHMTPTESIYLGRRENNMQINQITTQNSGTDKILLPAFTTNKPDLKDELLTEENRKPAEKFEMDLIPISVEEAGSKRAEHFTSKPEQSSNKKQSEGNPSDENKPKPEQDQSENIETSISKPPNLKISKENISQESNNNQHSTSKQTPAPGEGTKTNDQMNKPIPNIADVKHKADVSTSETATPCPNITSTTESLKKSEQNPSQEPDTMQNQPGLDLTQDNTATVQNNPKTTPEPNLMALTKSEEERKNPNSSSGETPARDKNTSRKTPGDYSTTADQRNESSQQVSTAKPKSRLLWEFSSEKVQSVPLNPNQRSLMDSEDQSKHRLPESDDQDLTTAQTTAPNTDITDTETMNESREIIPIIKPKPGAEKSDRHTTEPKQTRLSESASHAQNNQDSSAGQTRTERDDTTISNLLDKSTQIISEGVHQDKSDKNEAVTPKLNQSGLNESKHKSKESFSPEPKNKQNPTSGLLPDQDPLTNQTYRGETDISNLRGLTESKDRSEALPSQEPKSSRDPTSGPTSGHLTATPQANKSESTALNRGGLTQSRGKSQEKPLQQLNYTEDFTSGPTHGPNQRPLDPDHPGNLSLFMPNAELNSHAITPEPMISKSDTQRPILTQPMDRSEGKSQHKHKDTSNITSGLTSATDLAKVSLDHKPKPGKLTKTPKTDLVHRKVPEYPKVGKNTKTKPAKSNQAPRTNVKTPRLGQNLNVNLLSAPKKSLKAEFNKTSKPKPPFQNRPAVKPGTKLLQRPKQANPKTKTLFHPQISWVSSENTPNSQTDTPTTSGLVKQISAVTHSPGDTEFSGSTRRSIPPDPTTSNSPESGPFPRTRSEHVTPSPGSGIQSDLRPQTVTQTPSVPVTTGPNKIRHGIPQSSPRTAPGPAQPSEAPKSELGTQAESIKAEGSATAPHFSFSSLEPANTVRTDLRSETSATWRKAAPESSTPSARELRVRINQVAAVLDVNRGSNGSAGDHQDHPESKPPTSVLAKAPRDCSDHRLKGRTRSGVYLVTPELRGSAFPVFCDMERDGGGWTLIQRRKDGSVSFNRTWAEYRAGFGALDGGEFWLGNTWIHLLTCCRQMTLRVELEDFDGVTEHAQYDVFRVASERQRFRLSVGGYSGTAGDALRHSRSYDHHNRAFTTPDRDHDRYPSGNCGAYYGSGWWFDACMAANLNGKYYPGRYKGVRNGIFWGTWHNISDEYYPTNERQSFKSVRMMVRPKDFVLP